MTNSDFSKLAEAKRRWEGAEFNYTKNPVHTMKVRLDKARAEYAKVKAAEAKKSSVK